MEEFLIYIIKSAALSGIFILVYLLLLKNDTSFEMNRRFLLGGILISYILPFIEFTQVVLVKNAVSGGNFTVFEGAMDIPVQPEVAIDWWKILGILYLVGITVLGLRFMLQLVSLWNKLKTNLKIRMENSLL